MKTQLFNQLFLAASDLSLLGCDPFSSYNIKDASLYLASIGTEISVVSVLICFALVLIVGLSYKYDEGKRKRKRNNKCPRCAEHYVEIYVLPGKHCPICNQPC